jgi:hypothetical protein
MCSELGVNLQRGMNFRLRNGESLILMSVRPGAPYSDRVEDAGRVIVYEGHDIPRTPGSPHPKTLDQPEFQATGRPTQNGLFMDAVRRFQSGKFPAERVRVFEKIKPGIWAYNGLFELIDAWKEIVDRRQVFKFKLKIIDHLEFVPSAQQHLVDHDRVIPSAVKLEVWKRDQGKCIKCGTKSNLHFDHIIPYSEGGSSKDAKNIQILCASHNLQKSDRIE